MTLPLDRKGEKPSAKRNRKVSVQHLQRQCRTVLARDIGRLMDASFERALTKEESLALRGYFEILNELEELDKIKKLEKEPEDVSKED